MDKALFEKYINEMRRMKENATLKPQKEEVTRTAATVAEPNSQDMTGEGFLVVNVTSVRGIYPVPGARVTVFTGSEEDMKIVAEAVTDQSGKTPIIPLKAPSYLFTESPDPSERPFAYYNVRTVEDGFKTNLNLNVAIFDKITSLQNVNLEPIVEEVQQNRPIVIDEFENYTL